LTSVKLCYIIDTCSLKI